MDRWVAAVRASLRGCRWRKPIGWHGVAASKQEGHAERHQFAKSRELIHHFIQADCPLAASAAPPRILIRRIDKRSVSRTADFS